MPLQIPDLADLHHRARMHLGPEIIKPLADSARERLKELGYDNVHVRHGDGYKGWPEAAPFDAVIVTAAPPEIPEELVGQLIYRGRMVVPVGNVYQELYVLRKDTEGYLKEAVMPVRFVPMVKGGEEAE